MRKILFFLVLLFIFCVNSFSAFACSCIMPGTVAEEVERADAVFFGTVMDVDGPVFGAYVFPDVAVTFTVQEYWKGVFSEPLVIHTGQGGGDCGYPFEEGESYLVYAYVDENDDLHANICSRTALVSDAEEDLVKLPKGNILDETVSSQENYFSVFVFVTILLLISFVLFVTYTKNKK